MLPLWFSLLGCDAMFAPVRISPPGTTPDTAAPVDTASAGQDTGDTTVVFSLRRRSLARVDLSVAQTTSRIFSSLTAPPCTT
jgi:hypothetical protein